MVLLGEISAHYTEVNALEHAIEKLANHPASLFLDKLPLHFDAMQQQTYLKLAKKDGISL